MNAENTIKALEAYLRLFKRVILQANEYHLKTGNVWGTIGNKSCQNPRIFERIERGHFPEVAVLKRMDNFFKGAKHGK
jgi:hypothetical protein